MAVCYEPFFLDEKMDVLLDDAAATASNPMQRGVILHELRVTSQLLLGEFYDVARDALTPPTSPDLLDRPQQQQQQLQLTNLQPLQVNNFLQPVVVCGGGAADEVVYEEQDEIEKELAVVDELVRTRVEDMQWSNGSDPGSPDESSCSSSSFASSSSALEDPDWGPTSSDPDTITIPTPKKRPYVKGAPEEKKVRKKEQNKNAATRYRLKKKAEVEEILTVEKGLLDRNEVLKEKTTDLEREIKYLKGLMRDLLEAKGLI